MQKEVFIIGFILLVIFSTGSFVALEEMKDGQDSFYSKSLHYTGEGMRYWYEEQGGFMEITNIPYSQLDCKNCHVQSCDLCHANTFPNIEVANHLSEVEHEAFSSKINEEILFYLQTRGMDKEQAIRFILYGFCFRVMQNLPLEFAEESKQLLALKLEGAIG